MLKYDDNDNDNDSLFDMIMEPYKIQKNSNSLIAFRDNASAIRGYRVPFAMTSYPFEASQINIKQKMLHVMLTAETHNFPTGVCPFPGAATGIGGRIRDNQAIGRGICFVS